MDAAMGSVHDVDDDDDEIEKEKEYAWEKKYERTWEALHDPNLQDEFAAEKQAEFERKLYKRARLQEQLARPVRRGLARHLFLVLDNSQSCMLEDLKPNRLAVMRSAAKKFTEEYFDQNPISQLGVVCTSSGLAHKLTDLMPNGQKNITAIDVPTVAGQPSLQNALEVVRSSLNLVPRHGSREALILWASLSTCDPGDIQQTIRAVGEDGIRVSVVGMGAELHVLKRLTVVTGGTYSVALDEDHYFELVSLHVPPPPVSRQKIQAALVPMGFPEHKRHTTKSLCVCHKRMSASGYYCPRCDSKSCELPTQCTICGLTLISSPHLARSYHHLFALPTFERLKGADISAGKRNDRADVRHPSPKRARVERSGIGEDKSLHTDNDTERDKDGDVDMGIADAKEEAVGKEDSVEECNGKGSQVLWSGQRCSGCLEEMRAQTTIAFRCPQCGSCYCLDCDAFIHETLHNCPRCEI